MTGRHLFSLYNSWSSIRLSNSNEHLTAPPELTMGYTVSFEKPGHSAWLSREGLSQAGGRRRPGLPFLEIAGESA